MLVVVVLVVVVVVVVVIVVVVEVVVVVAVVVVVVVVVVLVAVVIGARGGDGSYVGTEKIKYMVSTFVSRLLPATRTNKLMHVHEGII